MHAATSITMDASTFWLIGTTNSLNTGGSHNSIAISAAGFQQCFQLSRCVAGSAAFTDFDGDGLQDVLIAGFGTNNALAAEIYRNNGDSSFLYDCFYRMLNCSVSVGDFTTADGRPDVLLSGAIISGGLITRVCKITAISKFPIVWGDLENRGVLDVLSSGTDGVTVR